MNVTHIATVLVRSAGIGREFRYGWTSTAGRFPWMPLRDLRSLACCLARGEHGAAKPLIDVKPLAAHGFVNALIAKHFLEQTMPAIEVAWQQGQLGVRLRERTSPVTPWSAEKCGREGHLPFHDPGLVLAHEQKPDDGVIESSIVESREDGAQTRFTAS
jgi:hypothetical protein